MAVARGYERAAAAPPGGTTGGTPAAAAAACGHDGGVDPAGGAIHKEPGAVCSEGGGRQLLRRCDGAHRGRQIVQPCSGRHPARTFALESFIDLLDLVEYIREMSLARASFTAN